MLEPWPVPNWTTWNCWPRLMPWSSGSTAGATTRPPGSRPKMPGAGPPAHRSGRLAARADRGPFGRRHPRRHGHGQERAGQRHCRGRSSADRPLAAHHHPAHAGLPAGTHARNARHRPGVGGTHRARPAGAPGSRAGGLPRPGYNGRGNSTLHGPRPSPLAPRPSPPTSRGCVPSCRTATCCWSRPRNRSIAAPAWPTNWLPRPTAPTWSSCRRTPTRRRRARRLAAGVGSSGQWSVAGSSGQWSVASGQ